MNVSGSVDTIGFEKTIGFLKNSHLFSMMSENRLRDIARESTVIDLYPSGRLFEQGDTGDAAFLVLDGVISVEVATESGRAVVATVGPGELVGEIAAFSNRKRNASVFSETGAHLLRIGQNTIRDMLQRDPSYAMNIILELGARLDSNNNSIAVLCHAANALASGDFKPDMLSALKQGANRFSHFAKVFESMASEITTKHQFLQEINTAKIIQRSFLPRGIDAGDRGSRFRIAAEMLPAKQVGGDFFDYFMIDDKNLGIAVGDVSGKGIPAAIFMSVTRTMLRTIARHGGTAGDVVTELNSLLAEDNSESMFVTLAYGRLNLDTGQLEYANAAHEEAYVLRADESFDHIGPMGPAVGLFDGVRYQSDTKILKPDDTIILGTDGITEAFNSQGGMYGTDRFTSLMKRLGREPVDNVVQQITSEVLRFSQGVPQSDDLTCLAARYFG
jgi:serine phosphatase RsbU (regulator of sigma subunit)